MDLTGEQKRHIRRVVKRKLLEKGVNHETVLIAVKTFNETGQDPSVSDVSRFFSLVNGESVELSYIVKDLQREGAIEAYRDGTRKCLRIKQQPVLTAPPSGERLLRPGPAPAEPPKRKSNKKIPDATRKKVVQLHKSGKNGVEISEILGISQSAVSRFLFAAGIRRIAIKGSWIEKRDKKIIDMINSGMTRREIAAEYGMSEKTIAAIIRRRYGVFYKREQKLSTKPVEKVGLLRRFWRWLY